MLNPPLKALPGVEGAFGQPSTPAVVLDAKGVKLVECDSNETAQMILALPDLAAVCVAIVANPNDPTIRDKAIRALAKFDGIGPYALKQPTGTE